MSETKQESKNNLKILESVLEAVIKETRMNPSFIRQ